MAAMTYTDYLNAEKLLRHIHAQLLQFQRELASGPSDILARVVLKIERELQEIRQERVGQEITCPICHKIFVKSECLSGAVDKIEGRING